MRYFQDTEYVKIEDDKDLVMFYKWQEKNKNSKVQVVISQQISPMELDKINCFTSSNEEANELMRLLYVNGMNSTTNIDSDMKGEEIGSVQHLLTYEEMFQKRMMEARYKE